MRRRKTARVGVGVKAVAAKEGEAAAMDEAVAMDRGARAAEAEGRAGAEVTAVAGADHGAVEMAAGVRGELGGGLTRTTDDGA